MSSSEKFCLRWNDFETNISTAFRELREDKDFFDVTLACDEDQIQAHKAILSACSPFFRSILRRNRHEHPLLYLKGVKFADIVSVLNFMYHGEVNVAQEELNSFLAVAEDLKVKGLTQNSSEKSPQVKSIPSQMPKPRPREPPERQDLQPPPPPKRSRASPAPQVSVPLQAKYQPASYEDEDEIQEVVPVKSEPGSIPIAQDRTSTIQTMEQNYEDNTMNPGGGVVADPSMDNTIYGDEYADYSNYEADQSYDGGAMGEQNFAANLDGSKELDALVEQMMSKTVNLGQTEFVCNVCQKVMKKKRHMMCHVETHIEGVTHVCNLCNKSFKTRNSLDKHKHTYHKGGQKPFDYSHSVNQNSPSAF